MTPGERARGQSGQFSSRKIICNKNVLSIVGEHRKEMKHQGKPLVH